MGYISEDFETFTNLLRDKIVVFEYKKKDGSIRRAEGTMNPDFVKEHSKPKEPEYWEVEQKVIDVILKEHNYESIIDYAAENKLAFIGVKGDCYVFDKIKQERAKRNIDYSKQKIYFDITKDAARSFLIENFLGVIESKEINYGNV